MKNLFYLVMAIALFSACKKHDKENVIGKQPIEVKDGKLTAEVLQLLGQVTDAQVAPDGKTVLYGVTYTDLKENKRNRELFTVAIDGTNKKQITRSAKSESEAQWLKDGKTIAFVYDGQIWKMNADGSRRKQITKYDKDIESFQFSPDETKILFVSTVQAVEKSSEKYTDLDKSTGRVIDNLMYKHWDEWVEAIPHPFVADYHNGKISNIVDLLDGEPYESPMRPWGGIEQLAWSPDSKTIAYTCRKKAGKDYTLSTNSDIYLYHLDTKETKNITEGMPGYDMNPQFSPDGKVIAWQSQDRDGYESDQIRLFTLDLASGTKKYITEFFDYDVDAFCWDKLGGTIYFEANKQGSNQLFQVDVSNSTIGESDYIAQLTDGEYDYASIALGNGYLVALRHSLSSPNEVYAINLADGTDKNISQENTDILQQITMGKVEARWIETTTHEKMLTRVIYPPDFDAAKKYPAILYCQGGPQTTVSQFWSNRWNLQVMAAHGYIIVAPNRHGVPGFGQQWNEQISGDYGGQNMTDYLTAIDALAKEPYVDENRLGCTGASYGGFSVYWLAGQHNKRFKAFFAHAGIFNLESQYLETEEMWFINWDLGGAFWDKSNKTAQKSYATSPHHFVDKWDTPIMISHGELDFRILASQGMQAFNAAQLRGIPSRMLIYPNENHWISQPQNAILFQREFFRWFDEWLKEKQ